MYGYNLTILTLGFALISLAIILEQFYSSLFESQKKELAKEVENELRLLKSSLYDVSDDKSSDQLANSKNMKKNIEDIERNIIDFKSSTWGLWNRDNDIPVKYIGVILKFVLMVLARPSRRDKKLFTFRKRMKNFSFFVFMIYIFLFIIDSLSLIVNKVIWLEIYVLHTILASNVLFMVYCFVFSCHMLNTYIYVGTSLLMIKRQRNSYHTLMRNINKASTTNKVTRKLVVP